MKNIIDVYHREKHILVDMYHPVETRQKIFNLSVRDIISGNMHIENGLTLLKCQSILRKVFQNE